MTAASTTTPTSSRLRTKYQSAIGLAQRIQTPAVGFLGGVFLTIASPPRNWWPLTVIGLAALYHALCDSSFRARLISASLFSTAWLGGTIFWMSEFHVLGYLAFVFVSALTISFVMAVVPMTNKPADLFLFSALVALIAFARQVAPFGGMPLGNPVYSLMDSPFGALAPFGGAMLITFVCAAVGVAVWQFASTRKYLVVFAGMTLLMATGVAAFYSPISKGTFTVAAIQGGGKTGTRALYTDEREVFDRQLLATQDYLKKGSGKVGLILWPENVVGLSIPLAGSVEASEIKALIEQTKIPLLAGVTQPAKSKTFRNQAVLWDFEGNIRASYDKEHRVPFGEYVPFRSLLESFADLSLIPSDAVQGRGINATTMPNSLSSELSPVRLGILISYEVFFPSRGKEATKNGANLFVVPTNASSYENPSVATTELAASQLQARQFGRTVVQSAPTGISAVVDYRGNVIGQSAIGKAMYVESSVRLSNTKTPYATIGDYPILAILGVGFLILSYRRIRPKAVGKWVSEPSPVPAIEHSES